MATIGQSIQSAREAAGQTVEELATAAGIPVPDLVRLELGVAAPSGPVIRRLQSALPELTLDDRIAAERILASLTEYQGGLPEDNPQREVITVWVDAADSVTARLAGVTDSVPLEVAAAKSTLGPMVKELLSDSKVRLLSSPVLRMNWTEYRPNSIGANGAIGLEGSDTVPVPMALVAATLKV